MPSSYSSFLEPYATGLEHFHSGGYITHAYVSGDQTLCHLPIASLITLAEAGEVLSMIACPRCLALVEAEQTPRLQPQQMTMLPMEENDG